MPGIPTALCVHTVQAWPPLPDGEVQLAAAHVQASVPHRAAYIAYELLFYCMRRYNNESFRQLAALFFRCVARVRAAGERRQVLTCTHARRVPGSAHR